MKRAAALTAAYYASLFFGLGAHLPYWPVWLESWGLTDAEIGTYLGLAMISRIVGAVLLPALADRFALRRPIIACTALATSAVFFAHLWIDSRTGLLAATLLGALVMAPSIPLGEGLGLRAAARFSFAYAPVRALGSLAFLLMNLLMGALIASLGPDAVLWAVALSFLVVAGLALVHPGGGGPPKGGYDQARFGELVRLCSVPAFICFALAATLTQGAHAAYYVYSAISWTDQGLAPETVGALWAVGVGAETVMMLWIGRHLSNWFGAPAMMMVASGAGVLRWAVMSISPGLDLLWPVQALHAATFGIAHLGAMAFIAAAIPERMASGVQGVVSGLFGGLLMATATGLSAELVDYGGVAHAYWLCAAMSVLALVASIALGRMWEGQRLTN